MRHATIRFAKLQVCQLRAPATGSTCTSSTSGELSRLLQGQAGEWYRPHLRSTVRDLGCMRELPRPELPSRRSVGPDSGRMQRGMQEFQVLRRAVWGYGLLLWE